MLIPAPKAILFDLGNTLVAYYRREEFAPILRESVVGISGELQRRGYPQDRTALLERAKELNREREDHQVWPLAVRLRELFGAPAKDPRLMPQIAALFLRPIFRTARVDPAALSVLAELRRRGIRTAIVSNTPWGSSGEIWRSDLERLGLSGAVDVVTFCTDVGFRKPATPIFEHALMKLGVSRSDAAFVGDELETDIEGARAAGIRPVLLDPRGAHAESNGLLRIERLHQLLRLLPGPDFETGSR